MVERRGPDWWSRAIANRATILVMEYGGEIVGYATVGRNRPRAQRRRRGVRDLPQAGVPGGRFGRRLFDACRTLLRARGLKGVAVWSLADNENAVRFYEASGGVDVATGSETFEESPSTSRLLLHVKAPNAEDGVHPSIRPRLPLARRLARNRRVQLGDPHAHRRHRSRQEPARGHQRHHRGAGRAVIRSSTRWTRTRARSSSTASSTRR